MHELAVEIGKKNREVLNKRTLDGEHSLTDGEAESTEGEKLAIGFHFPSSRSSRDPSNLPDHEEIHINKTKRASKSERLP